VDALDKLLLTWQVFSNKHIKVLALLTVRACGHGFSSFPDNTMN
jgi:hypothetical protein